ncbi:nickel-dependent hydrogenase large subunit [Desulfovibrio sp. OttesenSCG-928-C14]|nr:nickel-dependent hydrogenase large subunit [Desulfovibrio sp. OttesenSCG-928-C14]
MSTKVIENANTFTLPMGPLHVALEEPMYFKLEVEGEIVRKVSLTAGHVHRGMEALAGKRNLFQNVVLTERVCSLCSNSHPFTYCMAVENLAIIDVPPRAQFLRILAEEIKRVASHLFNVGILAHNIGYASLFLHMMEVREIMQDIKETVYGNRMDLAANCIGGVKYDIDEPLIKYVANNLGRVKKHAEEIAHIFAKDHQIAARTKGIGYIGPEDVQRLGLVGPVARGSGVATDIRKDSPYSSYDQVKFELVTENAGDVHARAMVRLRETLESITIIEQVVKMLPDGPTVSPLPMIPESAAVARSEAPRGELFYYIRTDETDIPLRLKWRVPSYLNWDALPIMMKDCNVADVSVIVNSIDPCVSCTER